MGSPTPALDLAGRLLGCSAYLGSLSLQLYGAMPCGDPMERRTMTRTGKDRKGSCSFHLLFKTSLRGEEGSEKTGMSQMPLMSDTI